MPPPMIKVTPARSGAPVRRAVGDGASTGGSPGCWGLPRPWTVSRRITLTSSSTERPFWAERSRRWALTLSSSFRMVRLATDFSGTLRLQCYHILTALQSNLADGHQDTDKGHGDDPERHRTPAVLAALGPGHRGDRLGRQGPPFPGHGFELLQHDHRPRSHRREACQDAAEFARAGHRTLDSSDRAEIAFDPFANHGVS